MKIFHTTQNDGLNIFLPLKTAKVEKEASIFHRGRRK